MISSRSNLIKYAAIAVIAGSAVSASTAYAQEKPRRLVPSFVDGQLEKPLPNQSEGSVITPKAEFDTKPVAAPTIEINQLGAVHPVSTGLLRDGSGGLGADMWGGSDPDLIGDLLQKISQPTQSPALNRMYRRLLLSGGALENASVAQNDILLDRRLQKTLDAGWIVDFLELDRRLPSDAKTDVRTAMRLEALLANGQSGQACEELISSQDGGDFQSRFEIYCLLKAEEFDRADVKYGLMEELGEIDPVFASLYGRALGEKIELPQENVQWSPLRLVMDALQKPSAEITLSDLGKTANLKTAYALMEAKGEKNFPLASELYSAGVASTAQLFANLPAEQPTYEAKADQKYGQYYLLLAATKKAVTPEEVAQSLLALWNGAQSVADLQLLTTLTMPEFEKLAVGDYGADFNLQAVKSAVLSGRSDLAKIWERRARRAVFQGPPESRLMARDLVARIDMYMLLSPDSGIAKWTEKSLTDWLAASEKHANRASAASLIVSQMEVMGAGIQEKDWAELIRLDQPLNAVKSNHSLENAIVLAASNKRKGETVALVILLLGKTSLADISLTSLRAVTAGLKAIGLEKDARAIALEAFIARDV